MLEEAHPLPDDIAALKAMVLASRAELAARDAELRNRDLLIEKLRHQLAGPAPPALRDGLRDPRPA